MGVRGGGGIWCNANRRVPGGSKGDTEGACVSLPNHCVALWGRADTRRFGAGKPEHIERSYNEEGEVEEEEERR